MPRLLLAPLLLAASVTPCFADIVYSQEPATASGGIASQQCSGCFGGGNIDYTAFDDFTLPAAKSIQGVLWQGAFGGTPTSAITSFTVAFWQNAGGLPGTLLQSYTLPGNANETFAGVGTGGFVEFDYSTALPTPFNASAGTKYWLSIQPTVSYPPQWFWREGQGGDGVSALTDPPSLTTPIIIAEDSAFALSDSAPVPEPRVKAFGFIILTILVLFRRKTRSKAAV